MPVALDFFLWLGPHLRVNKLLRPAWEGWLRIASESGSTDLSQLLLENQDFVKSALEQFNFFGLLRTWPVGVPSLIAPLYGQTTPLGQITAYELPTLATAILTWLGILLAGIAFGSYYFHGVAICAIDEHPPTTFARAIYCIFQTIALTILLLIILLATFIPAVLIISVIAMINMGFAEIFMFVLVIFLLWSLLPLVFSPHGIFAYGQNALNSLITSQRLVRRFLPGTGLFVLSLLLLSEGLDVVWRMAPLNSWMTAIGIAGHAFVTTGLLAASFVYYQGGMRWMQESIRQMSASHSI